MRRGSLLSWAARPLDFVARDRIVWPLVSRVTLYPKPVSVGVWFAAGIDRCVGLFKRVSNEFKRPFAKRHYSWLSTRTFHDITEPSGQNLCWWLRDSTYE